MLLPEIVQVLNHSAEVFIQHVTYSLQFQPSIFKARVIIDADESMCHLILFPQWKLYMHEKMIDAVFKWQEI